MLSKQNIIFLLRNHKTEGLGAGFDTRMNPTNGRKGSVCGSLDWIPKTEFITFLSIHA